MCAGKGDIRETTEDIVEDEERKKSKVGSYQGLVDYKAFHHYHYPFLSLSLSPLHCRHLSSSDETLLLS